MLVVVSDLHMTDRVTGASVTDLELTDFVEELFALRPLDEPLELLLLGDIVDLLRSECWDSLWSQHGGAAPWSSLGVGFAGFESGLQEQTLLQIIAGIERKYSGFFAALPRLKSRRQVRIQYVIGNHDFMLQLSEKARTEIVRMFALDQPASSKFPLEYLNESLDLYADHGHRHDELNYHQWNTALWAMGDGIVLRIVNEFARAARLQLHLTPATPLGRAVDEIDNVEPSYHIPLYVEWLATRLVSTGEQDTMRRVWRTTVRNFLELDYFREDRYGGNAKAIRWTRSLYRLVDINLMLQQLADVPFSLTRNGHIQQGYAVKSHASVRIFGHTHAPTVAGLPEVGGKRLFYVNTGTWRTTTSKVTIDGPLLEFSSQRVSTFLIVRGPGRFELTRRTRCP